jgi:hypothetical protein
VAGVGLVVPEPSGTVVDVPRSGAAVLVLMDYCDTAAVRERLKGRTLSHGQWVAEDKNC